MDQSVGIIALSYHSPMEAEIFRQAWSNFDGAREFLKLNGFQILESMNHFLLYMSQSEELGNSRYVSIQGDRHMWGECSEMEGEVLESELPKMAEIYLSPSYEGDRFVVAHPNDYVIVSKAFEELSARVERVRWVEPSTPMTLESWAEMQKTA